MGSASDYSICPKCGMRCDSTYWYHTGSQSDTCWFCGFDYGDMMARDCCLNEDDVKLGLGFSVFSAGGGEGYAALKRGLCEKLYGTMDPSVDDAYKMVKASPQLLGYISEKRPNEPLKMTCSEETLREFASSGMPLIEIDGKKYFKYNTHYDVYNFDKLDHIGRHSKLAYQMAKDLAYLYDDWSIVGLKYHIRDESLRFSQDEEVIDKLKKLDSDFAKGIETADEMMRGWYIHNYILQFNDFVAKVYSEWHLRKEEYYDNNCYMERYNSSMGLRNWDGEFDYHRRHGEKTLLNMVLEEGSKDYVFDRSHPEFIKSEIYAEGQPCEQIHSYYTGGIIVIGYRHRRYGIVLVQVDLNIVKKPKEQCCKNCSHCKYIVTPFVTGNP